MFVAFLAAILIFSVIIFCVWRLVKEKTAEEKERADEVKKATPDPNEFH
jgi:preprotein translocase subunit YajC